MTEAEIVDISPPSEPIALARDMVQRAPGCTVAVGVLIYEDGTLWSGCCGHQRKDVLWALQRMIFDLMSDKPKD